VSIADADLLLSFNCSPSRHLNVAKLLPREFRFQQFSSAAFERGLRASVDWDVHGDYWPLGQLSLCEKVLLCERESFEHKVLLMGAASIFVGLAKRGDASLLRTLQHIVGKPSYQHLAAHLAGDDLPFFEKDRPAITAFTLLSSCYFRGAEILDRRLMSSGPCASHRLRVKTQVLRSSLDRTIGGALLSALSMADDVPLKVQQFWQKHESLLWV
jgi:hypothetical protein